MEAFSLECCDDCTELMTEYIGNIECSVRVGWKKRLMICCVVSQTFEDLSDLLILLLCFGYFFLKLFNGCVIFRSRTTLSVKGRGPDYRIIVNILSIRNFIMFHLGFHITVNSGPALFYFLPSVI